MVIAGVTEKFAPLALVPMFVPPVETVYQYIVLPEEIAFKLDEAPAQIEAGVAVTEVGVAGKA